MYCIEKIYYELTGAYFQGAILHGKMLGRMEK
jgi:hypothetical protein